jgi:hypothetical protein
MTIGSVVFIGLLAMTPNWAIVDIPYPEAGGGTEASGPGPGGAEAQMGEVLAAYARSKSSAPLRKGDVIVTRIDGSRASARISRGGRTESVYLELVGSTWKIVKSE